MPSDEEVESMADELLRQDARDRSVTLRSQGILNQDRLDLIARKELPLSMFDTETSPLRPYRREVIE